MKLKRKRTDTDEMQTFDEEEYKIELLKESLQAKMDLKRENIHHKLLLTKDEIVAEKQRKELEEIEKQYNEEIISLDIKTENEILSANLVLPTSDKKAVSDNEIVDFIPNLEKAITEFINDEINSKSELNISFLECKSFSEISNKLNLFYEILRKEAQIIEGLQIPRNLWNVLFEYQRKSVLWLFSLYKNEQGGVLADEMGLGKTLQIIAFISSLYISNLIKYTLIIIPTTIINQWISEFRKFFPFLRILAIHKSHAKDIHGLIKSIKEMPCVVLLSYDGFKMYEKNLSDIKFDYLILDEGHKIKNRKSDINQKLRRFTCQYKIALTGTPIQNNLFELWAIFDFINPGQLGSFLDFCEEYEEPIRKGGYSNASKHVVETSYKRSCFLRNLIEPNIMRRLKSQVAGELPKKKDSVVFCDLTETQENLYRKELDSDHVYKILTGKINCIGGFVALKRICNHPYVYRNETEFLENENIVLLSGKMKKLAELLKKWKKENKKVLVFSQMIDMIELLEIYFERMGYKYLRMDGKTSQKKRSENIYKFNNDDGVFVFLLTTRVGGLGLNLVGASRIIIYDPDWNPSTDSQAKARVYRYGQKNDVETVRLISSYTIEEKIYDRQVFKDLLSDKVLERPNLAKFFDKDDLNDLFSYYKENRKLKNKDEIKEEVVEDGLDFFKGIHVDEEIIKKMNRFRNKKLLNDEEMIEYILLREEYEV